MIKNSQIVGHDIASSVYIRRDTNIKPGDPNFIMSRSSLMSFASNPRKWLEAGVGEPTESTEWGDLVETPVLSPHLWEQRYVVCPAEYPCEPTKKDPRTSRPWNNNATYCKEWNEQVEKDGRLALTAKRKESGDQAVSKLMANPTVASLIRCSRKQVMVMAEWHDPTTGLVVPLKALLDMVPDRHHELFGKCLADLKTSKSAVPRKWDGTIFSFHYDAQAAFHTDLYVAATKEDRTDWVFVVQENKPPYYVADPLPILSAEFKDIGRQKYEQALRQYCWCLTLERKKWPGYSTGNHHVQGVFYIAEPEQWMAGAIMNDSPEIIEPQEQEQSDDIIP